MYRHPRTMLSLLGLAWQIGHTEIDFRVVMLECAQRKCADLAIPILPVRKAPAGNRCRCPLSHLRGLVFVPHFVVKSQRGLDIRIKLHSLPYCCRH